jgi:ferredoxin
MSHYITKDCTACNACLEECPTDSIIESKPIYLIDADTCTDCVACVQVCPVDAIKRVLVKL